MIIRDVLGIYSREGDLCLETKSGVVVNVSLVDTPGYINLETLLDEFGKDLAVVVRINWDK